MKCICILFIAFMLLLPDTPAHGQLFGKKLKRSSATGNAGKKSKSRRQILYILTLNPQKFMTGNACVTNYTRSLGFEYAGNFDSPGEQMNSAEFFFRNFWTRTRLTFRNGPFWSVKVRRRIRECRQSSGELVD